MSHSSLSVARYMLDRADKDGQALMPMKIIKLVYLAHGTPYTTRSEISS